MHRTVRFSECFKLMPDMDAFFLDAEDERLLESCETSPSEDIWKKFEFLPTPPRSPSSAAKCDDERFSLVSDFLFDDDLLEFNRRQPQVDGEIISDCMWSGRVSGTISAATLRAEQAHVKSVVEAPLPLASVSAVPLSPLPVVLANFAPPFEVVPAPADCVDPHPLTDHSYHVVSRDEEEEGPIIKLTQTPKKDMLGVQTPSDSDDEVDVETISEKFLVHKPRSRRGSLPSLPSPQVKRQLQRAVAMAATRCTIPPAKSKTSKKLQQCPRSNVRNIKVEPVSSKTNCTAKAKHKQDQQKRSYHYKHLRRSRKVAIAAKLEKEQQQQNENKKRKWKSVRVKKEEEEEDEECPPVVPTIRIKKNRFGGSRTSSDSEDLDKRKEHNDLERRRRNDLKSSFQFLRQNVPDLTSNTRAPKVLILHKAVDYIRQLNSQQDAMVRKRKNEERRKNVLLQRLKSLQWMLK